jgi:5-methyltetrahydrofolate--homocysteine methyltransferase
MDGGMGTELQRAGIKTGESHELWNLTQPSKVQGVHQAYLDAGAECLLTNTFQANLHALAKHGLQSKWAEINQAAVLHAASRPGRQRFILADLGPGIGTGIPPEFRQSYNHFVQSFGPVDGFLLETASGRDDLISLLFLREGKERLPVLLSLTYGRNCLGHLSTCVGQHAENKPPEFYAERARSWEIDALGINCGRNIGMPEMIEIVRRYRQCTDLPLFARPNAGTPQRVEDHWVYPHTPQAMAGFLPELLEAGVWMIGGCCGTTPEHIAAFRPIIDKWNSGRGQAATKS